MRLVIQRVKKASVRTQKDGVLRGSINKGLLVLVGVKKGDTLEEAKSLAEKLAKLRIMQDKQGKMNLSLKDSNSSVLVISQFTLYADTSSGNRPSFIKAADNKEALGVYDCFVNYLHELGVNLKTGLFGEYMEIAATLDGPVTIII